MPFLPDERSTDKLLKNLAMDLQELFGPADLRAFGWYQYRDHDHKKTLLSTELAADAFVYLSFDADGTWRKNHRVIAAMVAFMGRYFAEMPNVGDIARLKALLEAAPLDEVAVADWFLTMYPPAPQARPRRETPNR